jgi:uncharacterized protein YcnI
VRRTALVVTLLTASLLLMAGPAAAHIMMMPGDVEPGGTLESELLVVHGCGPDGTIPATDDDASPTLAVTLEVPAPLQVTPGETEGWSVTTERSDDTTHIRWDNLDEAGTLSPIYLDIALDAAAFDTEQELWLPAIQECTDGERMSWTLPGMDERDGQLPGVSVGITAAAPVTVDSSGPSTALIVGLAVLIAGVVGGAVFAVTGRGTSRR